MSLDAGRLNGRDVTPPERDVTAPTRDVAAPPDSAPSEFEGLRRRLRELESDLEVQKAKTDLEWKRAERLRAWLVAIRLSCQGKAVGLAQQGIHSTEWPDRARPPSTPLRPESESDT